MAPTRPDTVRSGTAACYLVFAAGVCAALHIGKLPPAIGVLQQSLGVSLVQAGFLLSLVQMAGMSVAIFTGSWIDGVGLRRSMVLGLLLLSLASAAGGCVSLATPLLLLRAAEGFGFLWAVLPGPALLQRLSPPGRMHRMLGLWGSYMPLGIALGLLVGPWWIGAWGWRGWWWATAALTAFMASCLLVAKLPDGACAPLLRHRPTSWWSRMGRTLAHPGPWLVALAFFVYASQWLAVVAFLPSIYEQAGVAVAMRSVLTASVAAANVFGTITGGRLLQRGASPAAMLGTGFTTMALLATGAFAGTGGSGGEAEWAAALRYVAIVLYSAIGGLIPTTLISLALKLAPDEHTVATTLGWMQQWSSSGQFIGPPLAAWFVERAGGWQWTWIVTGCASLIGIALSVLIVAVIRRRARTASTAVGPTRGGKRSAAAEAP